MQQNEMVITTNGKLSTELESRLKLIKKKFNSSNDKIAEAVEKQTDIANELKTLRDKKKELTYKIDEKMKELKLQNKQVIEQRLMYMGERTARRADMNELINTVNGKDKKILEAVRENLQLVEA